MSIQLDGSSGVVTPGLEVTNEYVVSNTFVVGANNTLYVDPVGGRVGIGTDNPEYKFEIKPLSVGSSRIFSGGYDSGSGGSNTGVFFATENYNNDGYGEGFNVLYSRGTSESPSAVQTGDYNIAFFSRFYDGSSKPATAGIKFVVDGAVSSGSVPTAMTIFTGAAQTETERMRITSDGNVGIGTSSVDVSTIKLQVVGSTALGAEEELFKVRTGSNTGAQNAGFSVFANASATAGNRFVQLVLDADGADATDLDYFIVGKDGNSGAASLFQYSNAPLTFGTNNIERMRIDSAGSVLVNTTGSTSAAMYVFARNAVSIYTQPPTNDYNPMQFGNASGTLVGTIFCDAFGTSYTTSSDYRLKHDIQPITGALAKVQQLKPVTYKWNADDSTGEGFIAHELQEVCPQAVTGEKDKVDSNGKPVYQGVDTSFLVATLTAAIQELKAEVDLLKSQIN
jgi:hypothetical protein